MRSISGFISLLFLTAILLPLSSRAEFQQIGPLLYQSSAQTPDGAVSIILAVVPPTPQAEGNETRPGIFIAWSFSSIPQPIVFDKLKTGNKEGSFDSCFVAYDTKSNRFNTLYLPGGQQSLDIPSRMSIDLGSVMRLSLNSLSLSSQYLTLSIPGEKDAAILAFLGLQPQPVLRENGVKAVELLEATTPLSGNARYRVQKGVLTLEGERQYSISFPLNEDEHPCLIQGSKIVDPRRGAQTLIDRVALHAAISPSDIKALEGETATDFIPLKVNGKKLIALGINGSLYEIEEEGALSYSSPVCLVRRVGLT